MPKVLEHSALPLVLLRSASVTRAEARLLVGVDFALEPGARWAVLGENGAGKTTFLHLVRGDILPDALSPSDAGPVRQYTLPNADGSPGTPQSTPLGLRQRLAQVNADMQDAYLSHEWPTTALDVTLTGFADTALLYGEPDQEQRQSALALLEELGLGPLAHRRMATLSTGEARKVLLARALLARPDALILDECLEGLDVLARQDFLALLDRVAAARPALALLFSSHRQTEMPSCLTHGVMLRSGRIVASGPLAQVLAQLETQVQAVTSMQVADHSIPALAASAPSNRDTAFLARLENVSLEIGGARLLHHIDWTIRPGEHWAVAGKNGAGKSTLLSVLTGQAWPSVVEGGLGTVDYGFAPGQTVDEARKRIGFVSGALQALFPYDLTVEQAVWTGLDGSQDVFTPPTDEARQSAEVWVDFFGLAALRGRNIRSLSRGQLRRVLLARALAGNPALLVLDEPMAGLDAASRRAFRALLDRLAEQDTPLVMVTHHERDFPECISHVLALAGGKVVFSGGRAEYMAGKVKK